MLKTKSYFRRSMCSRARVDFDALEVINLLNWYECLLVDIMALIRDIIFVVNSVNNWFFFVTFPKRTKLFMLLQLWHPLKVVFFIIERYFSYLYSLSHPQWRTEGVIGFGCYLFISLPKGKKNHHQKFLFYLPTFFFKNYAY